MSPELLEVVREEKRADEENDAQEEGVGDVVAAGSLHAVDQGVVEAELELEWVSEMRYPQSKLNNCDSQLLLHLGGSPGLVVKIS